MKLLIALLIAIELDTAVPNLNFEQGTAPPNGPNQVSNLVAWKNLCPFGASPDYFREGYWMYGGVQGTAPPTPGGQGFVGVFSGIDPRGIPWYEYVVNVLPQPLTSGEQYTMDVHIGTTGLDSQQNGGGAFSGSVILYGLSDVSEFTFGNYEGESRPIEQFAAGNYVVLLDLPVNQPASMWTTRNDVSFTAPANVRAIAWGARWVNAATAWKYVLIDVNSCSLAGDFNGDGVVDGGDYVVWRRSPTRTQADYLIWRANFGRTCQ